MVVLCAGCQLPIQDKFLLTVLDRTWHCACVQCTDCRCFLVDKCFSRDGNLYCRQDFFRRYGIQCAGCNQGISPDDLVRRAPVVTSSNDAKTTVEDAVYHVECFTCAICRRQLRTGEELFVLDRNRFVCRDDCTSDVIGSNVNTDNVFMMSDEDDEDEYNAAAAAADKFDDSKRPTDDSNDNDHDRYMGVWSPGATATRHTTPGGGSTGASSTVPLIRQSSSPEGASSRAGLIFGPPTVRTSASTTGACRERRSSVAEMTDDSNGSEGSVDSGNNNSGNNLSGHKDDDCLMAGRLAIDDDRATSLSDDDGLPLTAVDDGFAESGSGGQQGLSGSSAVGALPPGAKRRGPRTTIKAKQLDTLKAAFAATPKPTRHIREQLARETGLNMRVIQVWFQNRRSKDRRIKQLNALGIRRQFFRGAHRALRALRPGEELLIDGHHDLFSHPGFAYFTDKDEFFGNRFPGAGALYNDYYHEIHTGNMNCMAPPPGGANVLLQHHGPHVMAEHGSLPGHLIDGSYTRYPPSHHPLSLSGLRVDSVHHHESHAVLPTTTRTADHPVSCLQDVAVSCDVIETSRRSPVDVASYQRCSNSMRSANYVIGGGHCDTATHVLETSLQTGGCGLTQQPSTSVQQTQIAAIETW